MYEFWLWVLKYVELPVHLPTTVDQPWFYWTEWTPLLSQHHTCCWILYHGIQDTGPMNKHTHIPVHCRMDKDGGVGSFSKKQLNPKLELFPFVLYWNIWINILSLTYGDNGVVVGECHSGVHRPHVRGVDPTLPHLLDHRGQPLLQIVRSKSIQWYQQQRYLTARIKCDTYLY